MIQSQAQKSFNENIVDCFSTPNPVPATIEAFRQWIGIGRRVLDVGCGSGYYGGLFAQWGNEVSGLELAQGAVDAARGRGVDARVWNIESDFPEYLESFDRIFCSEVLEHLICPQRTLSSIHKHLKADGRLIVTVPNTAFWAHRLMMLLGRLAFVGEGRFPAWLEPHIRHFTIATLMDLLAASGFEVEAVRGTFVGFPGTLRPYFPFPINKAIGLFQRMTRGFDGLRDFRPGFLSAGLLVLAKKADRALSLTGEVNSNDEPALVFTDSEKGEHRIEAQLPLPFADGSMMTVDVGDLLTRQLDGRPLLGEIKRVLVLRGRIRFCFENPVSLPRRIEMLCGKFIPTQKENRFSAWSRPQIRFFTVRDFAKFLASEGFSEFRIEKGSPFFSAKLYVTART